jgi:site-specific recombinase XerD
MIKKQEIKSLVKECTAALRKEGYTEKCVSEYQRRWRRLFQYMEARSISDYSSEVGGFFMEEISKEYPSYRAGFRRCVYFLSDYLSCGQVRKRITPVVRHELPCAVGEAATRFIESLITMRRSKLTIYVYQRALSYFIRHLSIRNVANPSQITADDVLSFLASVKNCKQEMLRSIRLFCRYLYEQKIMDTNVEYVIGRNNYPKREKLPSVYEAEEIKLIEESPDRASHSGKRDYAMLLLATRLGLRASDIAGLQFNNLDWEQNIIRLSQYKTGRIIELPLLTDVGEAIIDYVKYGRPVSDSQQIFLSVISPYRPVNQITISCAVERIIRASNVSIGNRHFGAHAMRHTLASRLLGNGITLPVISETLGHTNTQTTMEYLRIDFNRLMNCTLNVTMVSDNFYTQKGGLFYE